MLFPADCIAFGTLERGERMSGAIQLGEKKGGTMEDSGEDDRPWILVSGKKSRASKGKPSLYDAPKVFCEVEAKVFSIEAGYGVKKGMFLIREQKGSQFASIWVSWKALDWILSNFNEASASSWSCATHRQFFEPKEWLIISRGKNRGGEFMKLMGPNKKGGNIDLFFPSGKNGVGWCKWAKVVQDFLSSHQSPKTNSPAPVRNVATMTSVPSSSE
ncbi:hypothetical protein MKW92_049449, partial [Papaver armeniacum]